MNEKYKLNTEIGAEDDEQFKNIQQGVRLQVKLNQLKGTPVAKFDAKKKLPYLEYPDGRREYSLEQ